MPSPTDLKYTKDHEWARLEGEIATVGITGPCLGRVFNYMGVARLGAARATPLINSSPLLTTILALVFLREQITIKIFLGALCIVAGIVVLTGQRRA